MLEEDARAAGDEEVADMRAHHRRRRGDEDRRRRQACGERGEIGLAFLRRGIFHAGEPGAFEGVRRGDVGERQQFFTHGVCEVLGDVEAARLTRKASPMTGSQR